MNMRSTPMSIQIRYFHKDVINIDGTRLWLTLEHTSETFSAALREVSALEAIGCIVEVSW